MTPRLDAMGYGPDETRKDWASRDKPPEYKWPEWLAPEIAGKRGIELKTFELE